MEESRRNELLDLIYSVIPKMDKCPGGCSDCCGITIFVPEEWQRIGKITSLRHIKQEQVMKCPFVVGHRCFVYEHRPYLCRIFGTVTTQSLFCPRGNMPLSKKLNQTDAHVLTVLYNNLLQSTWEPDDVHFTLVLSIKRKYHR